MTSKINLSPHEDDNSMHTPIRLAGSLDGSNVMDSLRRRIASTALRPKPIGLNHNDPSQHATINLDDSDVVDLDSAKPAVATTQSAAVVTSDAVTSTMPELPRPPRPSSLWLQDVITSAQSVAEKIRLQSEQVESPQVWQCIESDCSSLGILTPSAMLDTFGGAGNGISDSYRLLMKNKVTVQGNLETSVSTISDSSNSETIQESQDKTLLASESNENSFSYSELDKVAPDYNMGISPQPDFGFDSKEFISADSSAVMKKMEDGEISVIKAAKNDPIPSFQRIDIGDFSGFIGDGEIDVSCRPSWISPEKRKVAAPRITIGEYFSLKSYHVKDLDKYLHPPQANAYNVYPADSVPALEPKEISTITLSDTIDITNEDADKTITLEESSGSEKRKGNDTLDDILDMTLIPGRDSVVSLSMIANLLNSTKGSDTVVGHLFDAAKSKSTRKTSTIVNASSTENIPPSHSNSRETFVISSSQRIPDQPTSLVKPKPRTPLKNDNKIHALSSPSRIPILSYQKDKAPSPLKRNVSRKHAQTSPYFRQKSTSAVKSPLNKTGKSSPKIKLPICIQGCSRGVVGLPIKLQILLENTSDDPIGAYLVSTSRSKHLEVCVDDTITIEPKDSEYLKFEATALVSGEHTIYLEVHVNFGLGGEEYTHSVLPFKLEIEAPKIIIAKQYKGIIDFGLRPEDSRKVEIFTVQNLGQCPVPLKIAIEQDLQNQCFFLLVPSDEYNDGIDLVSSMGFVLPGHEEGTDMAFLDIGIVFIPSPISSSANEDRVKFEAQMTVALNVPDDKSDGRVLDRCIVRGEVGRTLLLVSQIDLVLVPGKPTTLKIYNSGVVPLDLNFQATTLPDDAGNVIPDPAISIEPTNSLLIPNQADSLSLIYKPKQGCVTPLNRELHLSYDGLRTGNIVSLICQPNQDLSQVVERGKSPKIPLPLKTTRHQLSWGSISSGQMSQQQISFKNSGKQNLSLNICIVNSDGGGDSPFKLLSDASEVTKRITMQLRPDQDARVTVMFCPLRPGPAVAEMQISSSDSRYAVNKLLLNGYGGHSQIILRKVSVAHGNSWLILKPSFDDCVVGNFNIVNNGTLPACVLITSTSSSDLSSCPTVKPDNLMISARGSQTVSVRIPDVQNILSKTSSGEVVSLCTLKIVWINEMSRNRLRRLLPKLNTTERVMLLRLENMKLMQSLIYAANDAQDLADKELDIFRDYTFHTASSLCKDVSTLTLELRAEGTCKTCEIGNIDGDTASPFVSFMDTVLLTSDSQVALSEAQNSVDASVSRASSLGIQWEVKPKELFLMPANSFRAKIQVFNMSTTSRLCFDVIAREELFVSPNTGSVLPCKSATIEIQLNKTPSHHSTWSDAVKIYDANDVKTVCVRVVPLAIGKSMLMQQTLRSSCSSTSSSSSSSSSSVPSSQWFTPSKSMQSPFPFSLSSRSNTQTPNSDVIKRKQASTGLSKTRTPGNDVYFDTDTICFPWTQINTTSTVKITLYNKSSSSDKEVRVSRVPPPFSVNPVCFVVPKRWNKSISATFKPDALNVFSERIEFTVEDQDEPVVVCFQGNSVAGKYN